MTEKTAPAPINDRDLARVGNAIEALDIRVDAVKDDVQSILTEDFSSYVVERVARATEELAELSGKRDALVFVRSLLLGGHVEDVKEAGVRALLEENLGRAFTMSNGRGHTVNAVQQVTANARMDVLRELARYGFGGLSFA